ncbi:hypothetical protein N7475_000749 [Penicillium sp. IBT 31633x]|nr:hypothetical protein N7475_000749 [Penicillium sp. IBT 31633x]
MSDTIPKSDNDDTLQTDSDSWVIRPGIWTVRLCVASKLTLPDNLDISNGVSDRWRLYIIGEYEGFQVSTEASFISSKRRISWAARDRPFKFHVSASSSSRLTLSVFARESVPNLASPEGSASQVLPLGLFQLSPFQETWGREAVDPFGQHMRVVDLQNGTGELEVILSYTEKELSPLKRNMWTIYESRPGELDFVRVKNNDSGQNYGMNTIDTRANHVFPGSDDVGADVDLAPNLRLRSAIQHPFIAPLQFAFTSNEGLDLLSPLGSGGYMFVHLQKEGRFEVNKAKFYAAELVCILEYLLDKRIIFSLQPENILLDSSGHVSLCKPGLFGLEWRMEDKHRDRILTGMPESPAPEVLAGRKASLAVNWWSLGVILYEMLMGIPPFYDKDDIERRNKILNQDLQLPHSLPLATRDILTKLLDKDPTQRLGATGAAELKLHSFFNYFNWHQCLQREYIAPFKPHDAEAVFWREPYTYKLSESPKREQREKDGEIYEQLGTAEWPFWIQIGSVNKAKSRAAKKASHTICDNGWELEWEPTAQQFRFNNFVTHVIVWVKPKATVENISSTSGHPSESHKKEALAVALKAGYSKHVFSQILEYGVDLNVKILEYDQAPDDLEIIPDPDYIPLTPLEWAVEHERLDLISLFLDHGADANKSISPRQGPALLKAVRKKSQSMVKVLIQKTDRVSCTRSLALAVEQQDIVTTELLLAHGVRCDFKESDRPLPLHPTHWDYESPLRRTLEAEDLTPPLVRAARLGYKALVELLLKHGADANIAYHDLGGCRRAKHYDGFQTRDSRIPVNFSCGRAVQIAMEMGHSEIVQLLIDAGADTNLPYPVWPEPAWPIPVHVCQPIPREVYVEVRAGLEAAVARRAGRV